MKIGLYYGSSTCYTEMSAEKIQAHFSENCLELHNIKDVGFSHIEDYPVLILGISTWDYGELQEDWQALWDNLDALDLENKTIAIFGQGDQLGYSEWFVDAIGILFEKLAPSGADFIGFWPNQGYEFDASKALTEDQSLFFGLPLDDENQYDLSDERIAQWCDQLKAELKQLSA
ncbi:flavodoxin FldB [Alginatibacterium sediminis]|uniref:Flavodoxin n=1 Tax=Alginatibacterium sediminis TaxID=2164068 RepID=A0A420E8C0_9ALTE|nr:flavodoxin FldB [Alginatibacterium sediminis]RKF15655.1 flavodoxin FldB [Alginatibacterium sediminis]